MTTTAQKTLRDAVKAKRFDSAYYIAGEDAFQQDDALTQLLDAAIDRTARDFNMDIRSAPGLDSATLMGLLETPPILAPRRVVVLRDVNLLRAETRKTLDRYLEHPHVDVMLVLTAGSGSKVDKTLANLTTPLVFERLREDRIPRWIVHHAATVLCVDVTPEAAQLLHSAIGDDLYMLAAELDKMASYTAGTRIDGATVTEIVGVQQSDMLDALLDAVAARNVKRAVEAIPAVLSQPKNSAVTIIMALSTQFLALAWARERLDGGLGKSALSQELFNFLKQGGSVYTGRAWGDAVRSWVNSVERWTAEQLEQVIAMLMAADSALKESRISGEQQVVHDLVLGVCGQAKDSTVGR